MEWRKIGTKYELRVPLSKSTGINVEYLTREWDFRAEASIARRMSWAANRKTTRVEDETYCLLGIFDINMPTLYGEGRQAFQRLQAKLLKQYTDPTLFAWGLCHYPSDDEREQAPLSVVHTLSHNPDQPHIFLFSPSPSFFIERSSTRSFLWKPNMGVLPPSLHSQLSKKVCLACYVRDSFSLHICIIFDPRQH